MKRRIASTAAAVVLACTNALAADPPATPAFAPPAAGPASFRQVQMHIWISETNEQGLRDIGTNLKYTRNDDDGHPIQQVSTNVFDPLNPDFHVTLPAPDSSADRK